MTLDKGIDRKTTPGRRPRVQITQFGTQLTQPTRQPCGDPNGG